MMNNMFIAGDILKIKPEWLSDDEKKDSEYAEREYYVTDAYDGRVELVCSANSFIGYSKYTWPDYTMYKVGCIDPQEIKNKIKIN